jgi:hypothetical protein
MIRRAAPMLIVLASLATQLPIHAQSLPKPASDSSFEAFDVATINHRHRQIPKPAALY